MMKLNTPAHSVGLLQLLAAYDVLSGGNRLAAMQQALYERFPRVPRLQGPETVPRLRGPLEAPSGTLVQDGWNDDPVQQGFREGLYDNNTLWQLRRFFGEDR
jgi:hypothetical protein